MASKISPVIKSKELLTLQKDKNIVLIDARAGLGAKEKYLTQHLSGARFVDLDQDLAEPNKNPANGGRHPLPDIKKFSLVLSKLGITPESHVIVYDDKNGSNAAARFWWLLRAAGHNCVQVLDGGYDASVSAGLLTESNNEELPKQTSYEIKSWQLPTVNIRELEKAIQDQGKLVIDVRDAYRFKGEKEPIDLIAGHIPGAINIPLTENLDSNGLFRSPEELQKLYLGAFENRPTEKIIVHCGSGVTACHTILAMDYAGLGIPSLYVGSWSEWSRTNRPVAKDIKN